jgi:hypothetical protein
VAARIRVGARVARLEEPRRLDHRGLDLDRVDALERGAAEQPVGRDPGAEADVGREARIGASPRAAARASSAIVGSSSVTGRRSSSSTPASGLPFVRIVRSLPMSTTEMVAVLPSR